MNRIYEKLKQVWSGEAPVTILTGAAALDRIHLQTLADDILVGLREDGMKYYIDPESLTGFGIPTKDYTAVPTGAVPEAEPEITVPEEPKAVLRKYIQEPNIEEMLKKALSVAGSNSPSLLGVLEAVCDELRQGKDIGLIRQKLEKEDLANPAFQILYAVTDYMTGLYGNAVRGFESSREYEWAAAISEKGGDDLLALFYLEYALFSRLQNGGLFDVLVSKCLEIDNACAIINLIDNGIPAAALEYVCECIRTALKEKGVAEDSLPERGDENELDKLRSLIEEKFNTEPYIEEDEAVISERIRNLGSGKTIPYSASEENTKEVEYEDEVTDIISDETLADFQRRNSPSTKVLGYFSGVLLPDSWTVMFDQLKARLQIIDTKYFGDKELRALCQTGANHEEIRVYFRIGWRQKDIEITVFDIRMQPEERLKRGYKRVSEVTGTPAKDAYANGFINRINNDILEPAGNWNSAFSQSIIKRYDILNDEVLKARWRYMLLQSGRLDSRAQQEIVDSLYAASQKPEILKAVPVLAEFRSGYLLKRLHDCSDANGMRPLLLEAAVCCPADILEKALEYAVNWVEAYLQKRRKNPETYKPWKLFKTIQELVNAKTPQEEQDALEKLASDDYASDNDRKELAKRWTELQR